MLGRPLFVGDTVDLYLNGIFRGEKAVLQQSDDFFAKNEEIKGECKVLKNRSHADVKNGTIVDGVKYIKE